VAIQKCDDLSGDPKDLCKTQASAAHRKAKADATVLLKTTEVNHDKKLSNEVANEKAREVKKDIRANGAADKREADLKVAEEKCQVLASSAK